MSDRNFLRILETIHELGRGEDFQFDDGVLRRAFQKVYDGLDESEDESLKTAWTSDTMIEALQIQPGTAPIEPLTGQMTARTRACHRGS